jgi:hypothetical protein
MKKQSENSIVALTMQTEYKCLVVEDQQMRSLSDRGQG